MAVPEFEEKPIPLWQKVSASVVAILTIAVVAIFWSRIGPDFWPPDASRIAPNILASVIQWAIVLMAAALLWPPTRRRIHRFVSRHTEPLHQHYEEIKQHHEEKMRQAEKHHQKHMEKLEEIHAHLRENATQSK